MTPELPFEYAVVRIACHQTSERLQLLFASVEMLPPGRARPDDTPLDSKGYPPSLNTPKGRFSFRRVGMPAGAALRWYRSLETLPDQSGRHAGTPLWHAPMIDEPAWGDDFWSALAVPSTPPLFPGPMDDDRIDPFTGANREPVRVHRRFATDDGLIADMQALSEHKRAEVLEWLRLRAWVDFDMYPELIGSAALIVPDASIRGFGSRLDRDESGNEAVLFEVQWRAEAVEGFSIAVREERHGSTVWYEAFDLPSSGVVRVPRPQPVQSIGWDLLHCERGLIASQPPTSFLRSFAINSNLQGKETQLISRDGRGKRAPKSVRSVRDVSRETWSTGQPQYPPGRLSEGRERRQQLRQRGTEFWLDSPTLARDRLWKVISEAREDVLLVDPYADGQDLFDYGMASSGARVRLLTAGKEAKNKKYVPIDRGLQRLAEAGKRAEAFRMTGLPHDRFMVIDKTVWSIGASLNGLGSEATMLIRLRAPQPVLERLELLWARAKKQEAS